jgi:mannose-1-phosphate guanylyltransferase/phosphomannomutase
MVLAAGEGTRLRPLTLTCPKPMVPVANVPLLVRTLELLRDQGIDEIAVNLHHRADVIAAALGDGSGLGVRLTYSPETELMGTAGGVKRLERFLDTPFVVLYGDNLYDFPLAPLIDLHRTCGALATIATFTAENPSACGLIETEDAQRVTRFVEKPPPEQVFTDQANAGVYILEPDVLAQIPADTVWDFGRDVFPRLLERAPGRIVAQPLGGYLRDTGTPENYRQACWDAQRTALWIAPDATIAPDVRWEGRNCVGAGAVIAAGASLTDCILWDRVRIAAGAQVTGAVLGKQVVVGAGAVIERGALIADGAQIAAGTHVPADARIGPGETVEAR